jgi:hypothetical protein
VLQGTGHEVGGGSAGVEIAQIAQRLTGAAMVDQRSANSPSI